jgi:multiple sugar transport system ATP-binding protein
VAGFIGSPSMNFFPAHLRKDGSDLFVDTNAFAVKIPEDRVSVYTPLVGKEVILGMRPEDIHNPQFAPPGIHASPVESKVDVTELMGNEIYLYMVAGNNNYVARVDPRTRFTIGEQVQLVFNMDNMHIFDPSVDRENPKAVR